MKALIITVPERADNVRLMQRDLDATKGVTSVEVLEDRDHKGIWANTANAMRAILESEKPALVCQDDLKILPKALARALLYADHWCTIYDMVSLFTPPQKWFEDKLAQGYDGSVGTYFLWAQMTLVTPNMAEKVLETDRLLDPKKAKYHSELRFRAASVVHNLSILTLTRSCCTHDHTMKSTVGTPGTIAGVVRDTRTVANGRERYGVMRLCSRNGAKVDDLLLPGVSL